MKATNHCNPPTPRMALAVWRLTQVVEQQSPAYVEELAVVIEENRGDQEPSDGDPYQFQLVGAATTNATPPPRLLLAIHRLNQAVYSCQPAFVEGIADEVERGLRECDPPESGPFPLRLAGEGVGA